MWGSFNYDFPSQQLEEKCGRSASICHEGRPGLSVNVRGCTDPVLRAMTLQADSPPSANVIEYRWPLMLRCALHHWRWVAHVGGFLAVWACWISSLACERNKQEEKGKKRSKHLEPVAAVSVISPVSCGFSINSQLKVAIVVRVVPKIHIWYNECFFLEEVLVDAIFAILVFFTDWLVGGRVSWWSAFISRCDSFSDTVWLNDSSLLSDVKFPNGLKAD